MVEESPRIMTRKELKRAGLDHKRLQPAIKKKLIFANSMVAEIRDSFQANDEQQSTKSVINVVAGKIMKKYNLMRTLGKELGINRKRLAKVRRASCKVLVDAEKTMTEWRHLKQAVIAEG